MNPFFTHITFPAFVSPARILNLILIILIIGTSSSCKKPELEAPKSLQEYLKNQGVQETVIDLEYSNPSIPNKKYMSLMVTYNFSTSDGKPQKEFLGFILKLDENEWKVDRITSYTKSDQKAKELFSGSLK
jgi:hypothetical protein